jgi:predicted PurR-regulated permease PerM
MFETSGDILNLVIAISVLLFTVFLVWTIYYVLASLKKVYKIINDLDQGVKKILETIDTIKQKVNKSTSYFYIVGEVAKKVVNLMKDKISKNDKDYDEDEVNDFKEKTKKSKKKSKKNRK